MTSAPYRRFTMKKMTPRVTEFDAMILMKRLIS